AGRPRRPADHAGARLEPAGALAPPVPAVHRARRPLRGLDPVRALPGWHRAELRAHHPGALPAGGGRDPHRARAVVDDRRDGARRVDVGGDLRPRALVPGGVPQRVRLEPPAPRHRVLAGAAAGLAGGPRVARRRARSDPGTARRGRAVATARGAGTTRGNGDTAPTSVRPAARGAPGAARPMGRTGRPAAPGSTAANRRDARPGAPRSTRAPPGGGRPDG